jgi:quinol monooxygenase YgiN
VSDPHTPGVIVIGRVRCRPEQRADLVALLERLQEASRRDEGCLRYGFSAAIEDDHAFVAVEEWASRDALAAHLRQPHIAEFVRDLPAAIDAPPEVAMHEIAGTGPLPFG